jgi:hypothetical protein
MEKKVKYRIEKHVKIRIVDEKYGVETRPFIKTNEYYTASLRKGLFRRWRNIGHKKGILESGIKPYEAKTLKDMEEYIHMWHQVEYGDKVGMEVVKTIII